MRCRCGVTVQRSNLKRHQKTTYHHNRLWWTETHKKMLHCWLTEAQWAALKKAGYRGIKEPPAHLSHNNGWWSGPVPRTLNIFHFLKWWPSRKVTNFLLVRVYLQIKSILDARYASVERCSVYSGAHKHYSVRLILREDL